MKILITGGFGYVGSRLGMHLASSPQNHIYLSSRSVRHRPGWLSQGGVVQLNWDDKTSLAKACKNMDVIVHTAGMNAQECFKNPAIAFKVNGENTENLISAALRNKVSKFLYLSTSHVYSSSLTGVITEDSVISNSHPYATSHVEGEKAVIAGHQKSYMQTIVVRLANSFGPPSNPKVDCWNLVVNDLCKQAVVDKKLVIKGPSGTLRNFITLTDVCLALEYLINENEIYDEPTICNLGGQTKSILEIASLIKKAFLINKGIKLSLVELSKNFIQDQHLDFRSQVLENRGFRNSTSFDKEVTDLINFCELHFKRKSNAFLP